MRVTGWIWMAPAVFLLHDAEEILTFASWFRAHRTVLPTVLQPLADVTTGQFATGVLVLFAGFTAVAAHAAERARRGRAAVPFLLASGALVANGFTHLAHAAYFRGYTPGVVTALALVLPYGYVLGRRLQASGLITSRGWAATIVAGAAAQVPIIALTLLAVR